MLRPLEKASLFHWIQSLKRRILKTRALDNVQKINIYKSPSSECFSCSIRIIKQM
jgi:hypothetical protein